MHFISCASITHTPTALHIRTIIGIGAPQAVLHNDMSVFVHRELLMLKRQWDEVMVVRKVGWNFINAGHYSSSSSTSDKKINGEDFLIIFASECTFMLRDLLIRDSLRWKDKKLKHQVTWPQFSLKNVPYNQFSLRSGLRMQSLPLVFVIEAKLCNRNSS